MVLANALHEARRDHHEDERVYFFSDVIPDYNRRMEVIGLRAREWAEWIEAIPWELQPK